MIKKDCFAYDNKKNECLALKDLSCRNCPFYKLRTLTKPIKTVKTTVKTT